MDNGYLKHADLIGELLRLDDPDSLAHYGRLGMKWYQHIYGVYQNSAKYAAKQFKKAVKNYKDTHMSTLDRARATKEYNKVNGTNYKIKDMTFKRNGKTFNSRGKLIKENPRVTTAEAVNPKKSSKLKYRPNMQFKDPNTMTNEELDAFFRRQDKLDKYNRYVNEVTKTRGDRLKEFAADQVKNVGSQVISSYSKQFLDELANHTSAKKQHNQEVERAKDNLDRSKTLMDRAENEYKKAHGYGDKNGKGWLSEAQKKADDAATQAEKDRIMNNAKDRINKADKAYRDAINKNDRMWNEYIKTKYGDN